MICWLKTATSLYRVEQVDFLLVAHPHQIMIGLAGDRQDGGVVHLGVVQAVQQVDRARAAGGDANAEPPGELGVAAGGERRPFLVTDLNEPDLLAQFPQRFHEAVDPVPWDAEDRVDPPLDEPVEQQNPTPSWPWGRSVSGQNEGKTGRNAEHSCSAGRGFRHSDPPRTGRSQTRCR